MKKIVFSIALLLLSQIILGQRFTGKVVDTNNEAVAYANVILKSAQGVLIAGSITNDDGTFEISSGTQKPSEIIISFIGYVDFQKEVSNLSDTNLGTIILKESAAQLDEVVIKSKRKVIERRADRLVFNVQNSVVASGLNAMDAIKFAPRIDPTSDGLKVIGKSSTIVYVNGRLLNLQGESLNTYLKTLQSDNIKRVEVITSPSAKYEAQGNKAIVNIVLKRAVNAGFDGSINMLYRQRSLPTTRPSTSLSYSKGKISMSLNLSYNREQMNNDLDSEVIFPESLRSTITDKRKEYVGAFGNYDFNYQINEKSNFGFRLSGDFNDVTEDISSETTFITTATQQRDSILSLPSNSATDEAYYSISTYYDVELDSLGSNLKLNYNHLNNSVDDSRILTSELLDGNNSQVLRTNSALNQATSDFSVNSFKADLELIRENSKWELGAKASFISNASEINFFDTTSGSPVFDPSQSDNFEYTESILAAYLTYEVSLGEKVFAKAGMRYENTQTEGNSIALAQVNNNRFDNFFPSLFVSYDPNRKNSYAFGWSTNINRPRFYDVNPFRTYFDLVSFNEGNPNLLPSYTHDLELSYTYNNNFSVLLYGSFMRDAYDYITIVSETENTVIARPQNYFNQNSYGIDISYNWKPTKWLRSFHSVNGFYNSSNSQIPAITLADLDGYGARYSTRNIFIVDKKRSNRLYFTYTQNFPSTDGFVRIASRSNFRVGGIFTFLDKNLILNVSASDIFRRNQIDATEFYQDYQFRTNIYNDFRNVTISVTYKIGNKKSKKPNVDNDEIERSRM
jgi:hypothetical protein